MKIYTDIYDRYIRAELDRDTGFKPGSLRSSEIGLSDEGIYAVVGQLDSAGTIDIVIHSFLFDKYKFNISKVKKWLANNKGELFEEETIDFTNTKLINKCNLKFENSLNILGNGRVEDMPVNKGKDKVGSFVRWGEKGKKYYYNPDNEASASAAESKANAQGAAIEAGEYKEKSFNLNSMN